MKSKLTKREFLKQIRESEDILNPHLYNNGYDLNKIGGFRTLSKEEVERDRCKAYKYLF